MDCIANDDKTVTQKGVEDYECSFTGDCYNRNIGTLSADILVTGHSLGGALAVILANKYKACPIGGMHIGESYSVGQFGKFHSHIIYSDEKDGK